MKLFNKHNLTLVFIVLWQVSFSQTALEYMNKISVEFKKISEESWDYVSAVAHGKSARKIENQRRDMLNANRAALGRIKNTPPFKGDASYRDSVVRFLEINYNVLNKDFAKIIDMEEIAEQSYDAMEAYMTAQEQANDKLDAAGDVAENAQRIFAAKNNITLQDNTSKTNTKLGKASEVFKYYNKVFLIFYKPFKQEVYLLDAQRKNDVNEMKQNQDALLSLAKDAKEKIKTIEPYNKANNSLKTSSSGLFDFYIMEAESKMPTIIEFYLKKEKFDKLKTTIESKGKKASKEEIDEYNKIVNEYNKASAEYNKTTQELNNKRNTLLDSWNNSVSKFLDRNISKKQ
ncbi:MAG TPA: hypothetical protein VFL70_00140 [Bacteroidia bacterium]|nr:hypothetical protein [Bacteroidia bacterium]